MSTAESCSAKLYKGKILITAEMKFAWLFLHKAGIYGISWIHLMTIAFQNSFQDFNKEI